MIGRWRIVGFAALSAFGTWTCGPAPTGGSSPHHSGPVEWPEVSGSPYSVEIRAAPSNATAAAYSATTGQRAALAPDARGMLVSPLLPADEYSLWVEAPGYEPSLFWLTGPASFDVRLWRSELRPPRPRPALWATLGALVLLLATGLVLQRGRTLATEAVVGQLGPFDLIELLGDTDLSCVYRAWWREQRRSVAIKIPLREPEVFALEKAIRIRGSDNIVTVSKYGTARLALSPTELQRRSWARHLGSGATVPFMVMALEGLRTLEELLRSDDSLTGAAVQRVVLSISRGLDHAYVRAGVELHGDLKPRNILVSKAQPIEAVKLLDWGVTAWVRYHSDQGRHPSPRGTPPYMAPEVIEEANYSRAADLYGLGVIWLELLLRAVEGIDGARVRSVLNGLPGALDPGLRARIAQHLGLEAEYLFRLLSPRPHDRGDLNGLIRALELA